MNVTSDYVIYAIEKQCVTYSECVSVDLDIQRETRMRRITLASVVCPALPYFSTLSHKWQDIRKTIMGH